MRIKFLLAILALSLTTISCTSVSAGGDTQSAIEAARKAQKAAKAVGFEWRDMGKMIKKAEKAAKDGKDKKAIKIANTVVMHGKQALKQAEVAKSAGPLF